MTDHETCCCPETIDDIRALEGFYEAALHDRDELAGRLNQAAADLKALKAAYWAACQALAATDGRLHETVAERDRARATAARLEEELARGFRITAPPATLTRHDEDRPATPGHPVPGPSGALGRPGSENTPADTYPHKNVPESPSTL